MTRSDVSIHAVKRQWRQRKAFRNAPPPLPIEMPSRWSFDDKRDLIIGVACGLVAGFGAPALAAVFGTTF